MDFIATYAAKQPSEIALVEGDRRMTWAELLERRNRLASALRGLGVGRGDNVIVYEHNSMDCMVAPAAVRNVGAVAAPMNHRLTAEEVAYILDNADAAAVFVGDAFLPVAEAVRDSATRVRHWISMGVERRPWARPLEEVIAEGKPETVPEDPALGLGGSMIYTGGTTGRPKGAIRGAVDPQVTMRFLKALDLAEPHVHLAAGPLYHSAPGSFASTTHLFGGRVIIMRKFDAEEALRLIHTHRCSSTFMAPTLVKRIVDLPESVRARYDVSSMRSLVIAAAPCPMRVKEQAMAYFGPVLYEFYGSTELSVNTILRPEDVLRKPGSCGRAAPGIELAILDDDGKPAPVGEPGELYVRRYAGVFDGYYKNPAATRETQRGDWLSVGDVAYVDAEGFYYICDRKRDMIISGGVNIYPAEIEDALHRHPDVEDAAVFGVPDDEWGERVHAAVQLRTGARLSPDELIRFARTHLADYKAPREVSFHAQFPRDAAGKLLKRVLREPHWAGRVQKI
jgi:acyl-CoA synthetase (AMP-forming)/AMP-acid ligase II